MKEKLRRLLLEDIDKYTIDELVEIVPRRFILLAVIEMISESDPNLLNKIVETYERAYNDVKTMLKMFPPDVIRSEVKKAIEIVIDRLRVPQ